MRREDVAFLPSHAFGRAEGVHEGQCGVFGAGGCRTAFLKHTSHPFNLVGTMTVKLRAAHRSLAGHGEVRACRSTFLCLCCPETLHRGRCHPRTSAQAPTSVPKCLTFLSRWHARHIPRHPNLSRCRQTINQGRRKSHLDNVLQDFRAHGAQGITFFFGSDLGRVRTSKY